MSKEYVVIFDEKSAYWENDGAKNRTFLHYLERYLDDKLMAFGYVFLKDALDDLDIPLTRQALTYGWFYKNGTHISFGIDKVLDFSKPITIRFNIDGDISHVLPDYEEEQ